MFNASDNMTWGTAGVVLTLLFIGGFLVSWVTTDVAQIGRRRYIGVLALATVPAIALTAWAADTPLSSLIADHWPAGIVGGVATSGVLAVAMWKIPATMHRSGRELIDADAWEGVIYGTAEGILLSGLPVYVAWQAAADAGWNTASRWVAALVASAAMTAIHHFGYWDFRGRKVIPAVIACLVLSVGYIATGSMIAAILGHVLMHVAGVTKGVELPPHVRTTHPTHA